MAQLSWSLRAQQDLIEIGEFVAKDSVLYAVNLIDRLVAGAERLQWAPLLGRVVPEYREESSCSWSAALVDYIGRTDRFGEATMAVKVLVPKELGQPLGMYSHGVVAPAGELVVVAGQVGMDGQGRVAGPDVGSQTRQALENIRAVLGAAGCAMRDVIRFQTFLTRAEDIPGFMQARREAFPSYFANGTYPPNTLVVVSRLVRPELLVEIEAMAAKPARPAAAPKATARTKARKPRPAGRRR